MSSKENLNSNTIRKEAKDFDTKKKIREEKKEKRNLMSRRRQRIPRGHKSKETQKS